MKTVTLFFTLFLIIGFLAGLYVYMFHDCINENMENQTTAADFDIGCPDLLIKQGNALLLYNTRIPEIPGLNPIPFYSLDDYTNYLEIQRNKGVRCPVLFLQEENNAQGDTVYRVRPSPMNLEPGLPTNVLPEPVPVQPVKVSDASRDNPPYNKGQYAGFDPYGQQVGLYTELDKVHDSTSTDAPISDNPMDINWGGNEYTRKQVASGKYDENNVFRPNLVSMKTVSFYPGLYEGSSAPVANPGI
jgi:hypothetical protein